MSETLRHVHFVAIGGTGMGALAGLLHARGIRVTGSDENLYPPMSVWLERWGIPVNPGFRAENVLDDPADLVVIGNAVRPDNPEARAAIDEGLPYSSFPDAVHRLAISGKHSLVVAGTHGKTTTTSLVAYLLDRTGRSPSFLVGGISEDFGASFREGSGDHFVVEGDEYDTAFFDKTPKFLHYGARTLLVTSVEFDHADIYRDLDHVKQEFRKVVADVPPDGTVVAAVGHAGVRDVLGEARCGVVGYSAAAEAEGAAAWRAEAIAAGPEGTDFDVVVDGRQAARVRIPLYGTMNVENALGALAAVHALGVPVEEAAAVLPAYRGVKRRQELRGEAAGVSVFDDFAHHPTAVRASIDALRARFPDRRLWAVFEPRTNTSRRAVFQAAYAEAFGGADRAVIAPAPEGPIYSATGDPVDRFSPQQLARDIEARGVVSSAPADVDAIVEEIVRDGRPGDVVLVMSNGAFGNIWERLLEALRSGSPAG